MTHPDVIEASVVGRPNAEWGEDVVAFVVGMCQRMLWMICVCRRLRVSNAQGLCVPRSLPKNNYGKVLKTVLRESFK